MVITIVIMLGVADDTCDYGGVHKHDCDIDGCCLGYGPSTLIYIVNKPAFHKIKNLF